MQPIERPTSLTELVFKSLKDEIISGQIPMGEMLSESRIASRLQVSRTPVREAFARLELEGLVVSERQRGTFVLSMGADELRDICDTRVCLETAALRAAFERNRSGLIEAFRRIVDEMATARAEGRDKDYLLLDAEFHKAILDASGNRFMNDAYQTIAAKMSVLRNRLGDHADHMRKSFDEHKKILSLVKRNKLEDAVTVLIYHIGRKEGSYWSL